MAYRNGDRPGVRIKRSYGTICGTEIPKFNVYSGTDDLDFAESIEHILNRIAQHGGKDGARILRDIANRKRTPIDVYHAYIRQQDVATILSDDPLEKQWKEFVRTAQKKDLTLTSLRTRHDYGLYLNRLLAIDPNAKVRDLPRVLSLYREHAVNEGHHSQFRKVRSACLAYARNMEPDKQHSQLWLELSKIPNTELVESRSNPAVRVYECRELIEKIPDERIQHICWTMAMCGMSIGEYVNNFDIETDRVVIHGSKTAARQRIVPKLAEFKAHPISYYMPGHRAVIWNDLGEERDNEKRIKYEDINAAVALASNDTLTCNVFRHSYRLWLKNTPGIDAWRQDRYFGHSGPATEKIARQYAKSELDAFLVDDTRHLIAYIRQEWKRPKRKTIPPDLISL